MWQPFGQDEWFLTDSNACHTEILHFIPCAILSFVIIWFSMQQCWPLMFCWGNIIMYDLGRASQWKKKLAYTTNKFSDQHFSMQVNQGFSKVDHSGINARIVIEQINSAKKKTTSNRTWALDPRTVCTAHFLSLMPYPCARSHCLKGSDFNDPYVALCSTGVRHDKQEVSRVEGSRPVRGSFFLLSLFALIQFWHRCQNDLL